ncbi:YkvA family protein [Tepidibacter formicigenes]|jgi:uncharacterized membrane protein YkvA (DUF1232 family)|uniref:DUF1232 domain-containing protein n=1 Tax=Tepidibacter formicigenes DSM 15518 TaxID=1123349 RepID=A0A1M6P3Z1_9FIRM|nr:DUF1232 domain-containing protein [Tepidibacter formicigenes]SHK02606.1 Protein of unknown function [Tepidibacter formicigenes DSM 15518]
MKKLKYALSFFKRINVLSKFITDNRVSNLKKLKVIGALLFGFIYFLSPIDIIPEVVLGLGLIDDGVILLYLLTTINEELDIYEKINKTSNQNYNEILENVDYKIKDES